MARLLGTLWVPMAGIQMKSGHGSANSQPATPSPLSFEKALKALVAMPPMIEKLKPQRVPYATNGSKWKNPA